MVDGIAIDGPNKKSSEPAALGERSGLATSHSVLNHVRFMHHVIHAAPIQATAGRHRLRLRLHQPTLASSRKVYLPAQGAATPAVLSIHLSSTARAVNLS